MLWTRRTRIRPYEESDAPLVAPIFSDPVTMSFWPRPFDADTLSKWVERNAREFRQTGLGRMIVELASSGEVVGDCGVTRGVVDGKMENDLGYIIHHPYWNQGLGEECARAYLEYGLRERGLRRVVVNMPHDHPASIRVAEKLGMKRDRLFVNRRNRDILTYLYVHAP